jgi:hypothetical protein
MAVGTKPRTKQRMVVIILGSSTLLDCECESAGPAFSRNRDPEIVNYSIDGKKLEYKTWIRNGLHESRQC